jgi:hypothetical protein
MEGYYDEQKINQSQILPYAKSSFGFCALGMFFSLSALAQEEQQRILPKPQPVPVQPQPIDGNVPCPDPKTITLTAPPPSAANVNPSQLPASLVNPSNAEPNFGGTTPDKVFRHTFQFKLPENKCCQCTNPESVLVMSKQFRNIMI